MTTQLISFEGADDDTALVITDGIPEAYDAYNGAQFHIVSRQGQIQVTLDIEDNSGCWDVAVGPTDEAHPVPVWARNVVVEQSPDSDYSPRVTFTAPIDANLVFIQ